jgi:hypothetical protein
MNLNLLLAAEFAWPQRWHSFHILHVIFCAASCCLLSKCTLLPLRSCHGGCRVRIWQQFTHSFKFEIWDFKGGGRCAQEVVLGDVQGDGQY